MTLYSPRADFYPDPYPDPPVTPNFASAWTLPGSEPMAGVSAPPPPPQPRGRGLVVVAAVFSVFALALSPFISTLRPVPSLACSVSALVCAIAGIVCSHSAWSRTRGSGWRTVVVIALVLGYLALALGLFHILARFARELALHRRRAI